VTLDNNPDYSASSEICGNFTGSIVLSWSGQNFLSDASGCDGLGTLDSIGITLDFDFNNHTDTWFVSSVFMTASGSMIPTDQQFPETLYSYKNSSWEFNYISGSQYFSYACSEPPPLFQADTMTSTDGKMTVQFGLGFKNFQFQPFAALHDTTDSKMTDNVDDCTPFFNIYIWMFILCMLLLVSIVLCGMTMMCSLKTMDRFDDMRAKTINVNVVN